MRCDNCGFQWPEDEKLYSNSIEYKCPACNKPIRTSSTNGSKKTQKEIDDSFRLLWNTLIENSERKAKYSPNIPGCDVFVDMGLSVKWAKANLGAVYEYENGGYYSWGDIEKCSIVDRSNPNQLDIKLTSESVYFSLDDTNLDKEKHSILKIEDDISNYILGKGWRIPAKNEFVELIDNSFISPNSVNGIRGIEIKSMITQNSIFLPYSGLLRKDIDVNGEIGAYWTNSIGGQSFCGYCFYFAPGRTVNTNNCFADMIALYGLSIRPVYYL